LKKFVLDTNVILSDPRCIFKFEQNEIHIPLIVIEELDRLKKGHSEKARNAREFSRTVDTLRAKGPLASGIELDTGGILFISTVEKTEEVPLGMDLAINDDLIIYTAIVLDAIVVSKDLNVRLKSDAIGVPSEDYKADKVEIDEVYKGSRSVFISKEDLDEFRLNKFLEFESSSELPLFPNEYVILKDENNSKSSALARFDIKKGGFVSLIKSSTNVWGITPKNAEQRFALDALMNDEIKLVSLVGKAGTGKTLLAVAAGLSKTLEGGQYKNKKMLISRPVIPMGKDIGYLPGDIKDKLDPWMAPIYDNLDYLFGAHGGINNQWNTLVEQGLIKVEALTYIRGRSIPNQYMIVDEAQNLTPHEVKTIVTRVGEGTKVILTGDCDQIDSPYLDSLNNGLSYIVDKMKSEAIVAHVELTKGERSELAEIATKLL
jgi:PhoH-like ATPase